MLKKIFLLSALAPVLAGCSTTISLFPIQGPLAEANNTSALVATAQGIEGGSGNISLKMSSDETCAGKWSVVAPMSASFSTSRASAHVTNGMASAWATVYGEGYSIANVPGVNRGEAMLNCNTGRMIQAEFAVGSGTAHGTGVARDNQGNIYKIIM